MGAAFYAAHHVLVKGALFLAIGVAAATSARRLWLVLLPAAILALSLGGLPLTAARWRKLAVKAPLGDGTARHARDGLGRWNNAAHAAFPAAPCVRLRARQTGGGALPGSPFLGWRWRWLPSWSRGCCIPPWAAMSPMRSLPKC